MASAGGGGGWQEGILGIRKGISGQGEDQAREELRSVAAAQGIGYPTPEPNSLTWSAWIMPAK